MGCLLALIALCIPRTVMFFIWLLTDWFSQAYSTFIWPFLGFLFMPFTTLAYMAAMINNEHSLSGGWIVLLIVAVLIDLGCMGGSSVSKNNNG